MCSSLFFMSQPAVCAGTGSTDAAAVNVWTLALSVTERTIVGTDRMNSAAVSLLSFS